jgi:hypothetical protein
MSRTTQVTALIMAMALTPAMAVAQGNGPQRPVYQEHDAATRTTFTATSDTAGNAVLTLKGGDFVLEKVVAHTGDATMRLSQGKDVVTIALSQSGLHVARGQRNVRVDWRSDKEDKADAVRSVLLGSQAVRSFKRLVASIEDRDERDEDGPLALNTLVDGAVVLALDGDPDATRRIAKRLTRKHRAGVRAVKASRAPGVYYDCVGGYQIALLDAWGQLEDCYIESLEYSWWSRSMVFTLCRWEWAIRSQQYLWQFVSCFMFPW